MAKFNNAKQKLLLHQPNRLRLQMWRRSVKVTWTVGCRVHRHSPPYCAFYEKKNLCRNPCQREHLWQSRAQLLTIRMQSGISGKAVPELSHVERWQPWVLAWQRGHPGTISQILESSLVEMPRCLSESLMKFSMLDLTAAFFILPGLSGLPWVHPVYKWAGG